MSDQIKLAETMGWTPLDGKLTGWFLPPGVPETLEGISQRQWRDDLPDPFTDANDDYAVLEWIRNSADEPRFTDFRDALRAMNYIDSGAHRNSWSYEIGDYARAAISVLRGQ